VYPATAMSSAVNRPMSLARSTPVTPVSSKTDGLTGLPPEFEALRWFRQPPACLRDQPRRGERGQLDQHEATVARVRAAVHPPGPLQPVDQHGDGAGGQGQPLAEVPLGQRAAAGFHPVTVESAAYDHKASDPSRHRTTTRVTGDRTTGRLPGIPLLGQKRAELAKRTGIPASAIYGTVTVDPVSGPDLSYPLPPGRPWLQSRRGTQGWPRAT
jgi:hypothetical protein